MRVASMYSKTTQLNSTEISVIVLSEKCTELQVPGLNQFKKITKC